MALFDIIRFMTERQSKLGVTQEAIQASIEYSDRFQDKPDSFVVEVLPRIKEEQPQLFAFIGETLKTGELKAPLAYALGVALAYKILPTDHTKKSLTGDHIHSMVASFVEHVKEEERDGKRQTVVELSWFIDKLKEDSSNFVDWLRDSMDSIGEKDMKGSFLLGAIHVAMPFFMRAEAQEMDKVFFGENNDAAHT